MKKLNLIAIYLLIASFITITASDDDNTDVQSPQNTMEIDTTKTKFYNHANNQNPNNHAICKWLKIVKRFGMHNFFVPMHFDVGTKYNDALYDITSGCNSNIENFDRSNPELLMAKYLYAIYKNSIPITIVEDQSSIPFLQRPIKTPIIATVKADLVIPYSCLYLHNEQYKFEVDRSGVKKAKQIRQEELDSFKKINDVFNFNGQLRQSFIKQKIKQTEQCLPDTKTIVASVIAEKIIEDTNQTKSKSSKQVSFASPIAQQEPKISDTIPQLSIPDIHKNYLYEDRIFNPRYPSKNPPRSKIVGGPVYPKNNLNPTAIAFTPASQNRYFIPIHSPNSICNNFSPSPTEQKLSSQQIYQWTR